MNAGADRLEPRPGRTNPGAAVDGILGQLPAAIEQAHERIIGERPVAGADKLLSLYEGSHHVLVRGKAGAEVEFGNPRLLAENLDGIIVTRRHREDGLLAARQRRRAPTEARVGILKNNFLSGQPPGAWLPAADRRRGLGSARAQPASHRPAPAGQSKARHRRRPARSASRRNRQPPDKHQTSPRPSRSQARGPKLQPRRSPPPKPTSRNRSATKNRSQRQRKPHPPPPAHG